MMAGVLESQENGTLLNGLEVRMAEEKVTQNREDIIRIEGHLKLINQKLDNHVNHMSSKIDTIFKIVWTVSFMVLGLILKAVYTGLMG
jgi:hypothetical protein